MAKELPQVAPGALFMTDGGLETTLIFHQGQDLPDFAAFTLLAEDSGRDEIRSYFEPYLASAREAGVGFVLDTVTWRASPDWAERLGYSLEALDDANRASVDLAREIAGSSGISPVVIDGVVGPRGDGYAPESTMSAADAEIYHARQIGTFADAGVDMVSAITMTYADEAIGIARAAAGAGVPAAISFTVETDGRLPDGQPLAEAVEQVDAETDRAPAYFMINCAHPTHFSDALAPGDWLSRIAGIRANASMMSHAELDEASELDDGDPDDLARRYADLHARLPALSVIGGCCGTDHRHVAAAAAACLST